MAIGNTGNKVTVEFTGADFKQQYIHILSQQMPLANLEGLSINDITLQFKADNTNGTILTTLDDTGKVQAIANLPSNVEASATPEPSQTPST